MRKRRCRKQSQSRCELFDEPERVRAEVGILRVNRLATTLVNAAWWRIRNPRERGPLAAEGAKRSRCDGNKHGKRRVAAMTKGGIRCGTWPQDAREKKGRWRKLREPNALRGISFTSLINKKKKEREREKKKEQESNIGMRGARRTISNFDNL